MKVVEDGVEVEKEVPDLTDLQMLDWMEFRYQYRFRMSYAELLKEPAHIYMRNQMFLDLIAERDDKDIKKSKNAIK